MATEFGKSLSGSFEPRWLRNLFIPALIFWGAGLWVWAQLEGTQDLIKTWQGYSTEEQVFWVAVGLLLVFISATLLESFAGALLRFYEGYWLRWSRLSGRRADDLDQKQERHRVLRTKLVTGKITPAERAEMARLDSELAHRPREPERSMPTRLGDILRTAEDYARERYGLDPIVLWPRLFPHLSEPLRQALGATQDQLDLTLRLATLVAFYGAIWSIVVAVRGRWGLLWWTLPALPLAWLLWRAAHRAAVSYAGLFRSAFDVHRFDVYKSLHWPTPTSPETEKARGAELTLFLTQGTAIGDMVYVREGQEEREEK